MARKYTANDIINRVAAECGIAPVSDPYASNDDVFLQLRTLLDSCGQELVELFDWQELTKEYSITTQAGDTGKYDLPSDYSKLIDQTLWDRTNDVPVFGPLSPQDWAYLLGRDLVSHTIYASFRLQEGQFWIFPQPPPENTEIYFEYQSRNWVEDSANPGFTDDVVKAGADTVMLEPIMIIKMLKSLFLSSKGFDNSSADMEFNLLLDRRRAADTASKVLNAGRFRRDFPYLDAWRNLPDQGYGR